MKDKTYILFCEDTLEPNKVDPDYLEEYESAKSSGFETLIFNFEDLTSENRFQNATRKIRQSEKLANVIYRGWMLTPTQYELLYKELLAKNYKLINSVAEYQKCHYLPDSLKFIESRTPKTIYEKFVDEKSIERVIEKAKVFGTNSVIIKDYVKSEKHYWETACFVKDASDVSNLRQIIEKFIELRGEYLNEGIVIREFVELKDLTIHSKSGMPLTEEYRLFFCNEKLVGIYNYWEEGEYDLEKPDTKEFEEISQNIESNYFSLDIARQTNGEFIIVELGDGQVSGLPEKVDNNEFYSRLKSSLV